MTKVVISGYYGFKNFGDEMILSVLTEHLKSLNIDITVLSSNPEFTCKNYGVNSVKSFDIPKVFSAILKSDVLISGGGSLLQDATSMKSLVYYLLVISLGLLFRKKVVIFAQGIGPINNVWAQTLTAKILKYCTYVSVRDETSLSLLNEWKIKGDLVCDPAYSLKIEPQEKTPTVGIQLRDFKTMNYTLLQKLAQLVCSKFSDRKIQIFSLQKSQDYDVCLKFENLIKAINPNIQTEIVEENIIENLSKLEYLFAMRFHALLIAIKSGVKTCAINYDIKVEKLAKNFDIPKISMNASENFEQIYYQIESLDSNKLIESAKSKKFDWSGFDNAL